MRFVFNEEKAAQAAAYLIRLHGGRINLMALLKLLYLADRQSLLATGQTITGDQRVSMPHGPVLSRIYDSAKWPQEGREDESWCRYMSERQRHEVELTTEPSFDEDYGDLTNSSAEAMCVEQHLDEKRVSIRNDPVEGHPREHFSPPAAKSARAILWFDSGHGADITIRERT